MRAGFFHSTKFLYSDQGVYYSQDSLNYDVWKRYLKHFETLTIVSRSIKIKDKKIERYTIASGKNVNFVSVPSLNRLNSKLFISARKIIRKVLNEIDCAIVRLPSIVGFIACHEAIRLNKPWVVEVVGCPLDSLWNHGKLLAKLAAPVMFILNRYYIKKAQYVIYVSQQFLQKRYPCKGINVGCSDVNIVKISETLFLERLKRIEKGFEKTPIKLGLVGSLDVNYKGHKTAIYALAFIKERIPDFRLCLVGGGNQNRWRNLAVELGIGDKVEFCGILPSGEAILNWFDNIDIYLQPSKAESHGRAAVEAMSRGCPIIVANIGGLIEYTEPEWRHKPTDYKMLALLIEKLITDKRLMKERAIYSYTKSREYHYINLENKRNEFFNKVINDVGNYGNLF